jgi:hypothetical protein
LLAPDLLQRIGSADRELVGNRPEDYHLAAGERLGQAASRRWEYLLGAYRAFRDRLERLSETDPATTETRERWLLVLLSELGFGRVPYVRGGLAAGGKSYPVSHLWEQVPVHLVGWHTDLDRRTGGGEMGRAAQSMLQEFLNVSEAHLWGILSNGRLLRILRDSAALVGSAYVEFDLEAIFDGELYSEFTLLFALLHSSRFEPISREDGGTPIPADCWLERWREQGIKDGSRARDRLRDGVEEALNVLGTGFLEANPSLREALEAGAHRGISIDDLHHELLRLAYQIIFLFVAEDRGALLDPSTSEETSRRYDLYFSTRRLRQIAARRAGDRHADLWQTFVVVLDALGSDGGQPEVGLPALGGLFFRASTQDGDHDIKPDLLRGCQLRNADLLEAVRHLATFRDRRGYRQNVDFRHLGAEELGSIYESLLELVPATEPGPRFVLRPVAGNERKTTGSYYTPSSLVESLLDSALDPVIEEAAASGVPDDLLRITVCDPACGSGHFLIAAARRIAKRYAAMYHGDEEPTPEHVQHGLRKVVAHCIHGVDINPLAAELAKVSLWLESLEPGQPLEFLDAHIKVGNALLGTTPKLLKSGLPDDAFKPIEGDDPKIAASLRRQNEKERGNQLELGLFDVATVRVGNAEVAAQVGRLATLPSRSLADIREQARRYRELDRSPDLKARRRIADAWCAAFVWRKHAQASEAITTETLNRLNQGYSLSHEVGDELDRLTEQYRFFHWHLEFPDLFRVEDQVHADHHPDTGWRGGFSCVVGNPPWERVKLQEKEFFAARRPEIAQAANAAARKRLIQRLTDSDNPADRSLANQFQDELRTSAGWSHLLRDSGRYPLTGTGDVNTYAVFAETARTLLGPSGRSGFVLPTGIATDATTQYFFRDLIERRALASVFDFENEEKIFPAITNRVRFCLLTVTGWGTHVDEVRLAFRARQVQQLPEKTFSITPSDILRLNPNTGTCPVFDSPRHAEIVLGIYRRVPILWREQPESNPWNISFMRMFDMANDARLFQIPSQLEADGWKLRGNVFTKGTSRMLPLYEAKMLHHFDHRFATYEGATQAQMNKGTLPRTSATHKADPAYMVMPEYWISKADVDERLGNRWEKLWLFGWRDICRSGDERTMICSPLPRVAVGHKLPLVFTYRGGFLLAALWSSFVFDYITRQKFVGSSMTYFILKQLPVLPPDDFLRGVPWAGGSLDDWITERVLELCYTAWDMEPFARDLSDREAPFVWDEGRRFKMRAELDAAFFHLYGVERDDVGYIMDSFRAFRNNDPERFSRTKALILEIYDAMTTATKVGRPYKTILDPPPGHGQRHTA